MSLSVLAVLTIRSQAKVIKSKQTFKHIAFLVMYCYKTFGYKSFCGRSQCVLSN